MPACKIKCVLCKSCVKVCKNSKLRYDPPPPVPFSVACFSGFPAHFFSRKEFPLLRKQCTIEVIIDSHVVLVRYGKVIHILQESFSELFFLFFFFYIIIGNWLSPRPVFKSRKISELVFLTDFEQDFLQSYLEIGFKKF